MDFCLQKISSLATATVTNVINGDQFELVGADSLLDFGFAANVTGLLIDVLLTDRTVCRQLSPTLKTINNPPVVPDDFPMRKVEAFAGDRIVISVSNPTAGTIVLCWAVCIHS